MNAFGEQLDLEQAERAIAEACRRAHAEIVDFLVAPYCASSSEPRGRHEWLVEFLKPPRCPVAIFVHVLDETLQRLNPAYGVCRAGDRFMLGPVSWSCRPARSIDGAGGTAPQRRGARRHASSTIARPPTVCSKRPASHLDNHSCSPDDGLSTRYARQFHERASDPSLPCEQRQHRRRRCF